MNEQIIQNNEMPALSITQMIPEKLKTAVMQQAGALPTSLAQIDREKAIDLALLAGIAYVTLKGLKRAFKLTLIGGGLWYVYNKRRAARATTLAGAGYEQWAKRLT